jgi:hypothetical protein
MAEEDTIGWTSMPTHKKARQLAKEIENVYPESLAERLGWWCHVLGVNRPRFLRMLGMSTDEANSQKNKTWAEIVKTKRWRENGWWVEGKLHELLALFDYDWKALAGRLHQRANGQKEELTRVTRPQGDIAKLQCTANGDGTDILLNQLAKGGPQSFSALIAYLSGEVIPGGRVS